MTCTILAEKPDQARHYAAAFQRAARWDGYFEVIDDLFHEPVFLTYGFGHLVELAEPAVYDPDWEKWSLNTLPMLPPHYRFCVPADKQKQFAIVKRLLDRSDAIIVATDSDREGENIARSIITQSGNADKPIRRLWINSLETEEIRRGFAELKDGADFVSSYWEAQSRQIADWLVGLNATRLFTLLLRQKGLQGTYSVGRVQTPTLAMIAARQQAIESFKPENFVEIRTCGQNPGLRLNYKSCILTQINSKQFSYSINTIEHGRLYYVNWATLREVRSNCGLSSIRQTRMLSTKEVEESSQRSNIRQP